MEKQIAREYFTLARREKRFPREHFALARQQKRFPREHFAFPRQQKRFPRCRSTQPPQPGGARSRKFSLYTAGNSFHRSAITPRAIQCRDGPTGLAVAACSFFGSLTGLRR